jgi:hypothetical protein
MAPATSSVMLPGSGVPTIATRKPIMGYWEYGRKTLGAARQLTTGIDIDSEVGFMT